MRTNKGVQNMVDAANNYMRRNSIKEYDDAYTVVMLMLMNAGQYRGFNYYRCVEQNGIKLDILAGTDDKSKYDYCLFY